MKKRLYSVLYLVLALGFLLTSCSRHETKGTVTVASKQFTENILLSEMYAQLIENRTDLQVVRKQDIGTTAVCYTAMKKAEVDMYVEYTGTICKEILKHQHDTGLSNEALYEMLSAELYEKDSITVLRPIGLNNNYALAMLRDKAEAYAIDEISDLADVAPKLVFAANDLFFTRVNDGYDTMVEKYGLRFKSIVKMNNSLLYDAAGNDQIDVVVSYATDSSLTKYDMVVLNDDKRMFPDYYALPIIRSEILEKYPELTDVLNLLEDSIDNECMQGLNYLIDIEKKQPEDVAKSFLTERGLLLR